MSGLLDAVRTLSSDFYSFFSAHWPDAKDFFDSVFFSAIAGSAAGAFAGARAAQRIAERTRNREENVREIRNTNAATMVAFGICNSLISAKKQHIKSLKEGFDSYRSLAKDALSKQQIGQGGVFEFHADFRTLPSLNLPTSILQEQIFEKLSLHGRPIALITTLSQVIDGLNLVVMKRNQLIESYKARALPVNELLALYFGFPFNGQTNQEYPDTIDAIYRHADDEIFFSSQLCSELSEHGDQLSAAFKKRFGKGGPRVTKPDFSKAKDAELMPSDADYADWINMFVRRPDT